MYVDWPLAGFIAVCLLAATLACRLLEHTARISFRVIGGAIRRHGRQADARLTQATFVGQRSSS